MSVKNACKMTAMGMHKLAELLNELAEEIPEDERSSWLIQRINSFMAEVDTELSHYVRGETEHPATAFSKELMAMAKIVNFLGEIGPTDKNKKALNKICRKVFSTIIEMCADGVIDLEGDIGRVHVSSIPITPAPKEIQ